MARLLIPKVPAHIGIIPQAAAGVPQCGPSPRTGRAGTGLRKPVLGGCQGARGLRGRPHNPLWHRASEPRCRTAAKWKRRLLSALHLIKPCLKLVVFDELAGIDLGMTLSDYLALPPKAGLPLGLRLARHRVHVGTIRARADRFYRDHESLQRGLSFHTVLTHALKPVGRQQEGELSFRAVGAASGLSSTRIASQLVGQLWDFVH